VVPAGYCIVRSLLLWAQRICCEFAANLLPERPRANHGSRILVSKFLWKTLVFHCSPIRLRSEPARATIGSVAVVR
jgi:hypothetical protein